MAWLWLRVTREFSIISPLLIILIIFAAFNHLCHPWFDPLSQPLIKKNPNIFSQLIKIVGWSFSINLISFDWNLPDSEISWLQLYIQVKLSSKTAVSQLLAFPSVSYFWSACHPHSAFFFFFSCGELVWKLGIATMMPSWKMWFLRPFGGASCYYGERRAARWAVRALCKDMSAQGQFGSKVNDHLWLSISPLKNTRRIFIIIYLFSQRLWFISLT